MISYAQNDHRCHMSPVSPSSMWYSNKVVGSIPWSPSVFDTLWAMWDMQICIEYVLYYIVLYYIVLSCIILYYVYIEYIEYIYIYWYILIYIYNYLLHIYIIYIMTNVSTDLESCLNTFHPHRKDNLKLSGPGVLASATSPSDRLVQRQVQAKMQVITWRNQVFGPDIPPMVQSAWTPT